MLGFRICMIPKFRESKLVHLEENPRKDEQVSYMAKLQETVKLFTSSTKFYQCNSLWDYTISICNRPILLVW